LAFYGAEDLTPPTLYSRDDARHALDGARIVVSAVGPVTPDDRSADGAPRGALNPPSYG